MRPRNYIIGGLCSAVIVAQGASTPGGNDPAVGDDGLDVVPEQNLKEMRGGMDLGNNLVGYFAIDRVVEVDGQVVAKMQIVVSNLDRLSTGGMPTVSISGPLSELVQIMNGPAGSGGAAGTAAVTAAAKMVGVPTSAQTGAAGSANVPTGSVASTSTAAGGSGAAAAQAVAAASGISAGAGAAGSPTSGSGTVSSQFQSTVTIVPQGASGSTPSTGTSGTVNTSETLNKVIPIGDSGQYVVVSNLPSSAGLATAIQNEVRGAMVQVQTTITAQLNNLTMLNSAALANALHSVNNIPTVNTGH